MRETIRVLHVDDDPDFSDLAAELLQREDERLEVVTEPSAAAGLDHLEDEVPDCIVSDYDMPGQDGIEFLEAVRARDADLPFILFTGKGSEEVASDALSAGATDYLQKESSPDQFAVLANRIENVVQQYRSTRELERERDRMEFALEATDAAIWTHDVETDEMSIHPTICPVFDAPIASLEEWLAEVHARDRDTAEETIRTAASAEEPFSLQFRFPGEESTRWGEMTGRTIAEDGEVPFQTGITRDITDQKEQKRRFEVLANNLPGMVYRCANEPEWPMEDVRGNVASFAGYTAAELEENQVSWGEEVIHDEDQASVWQTVQDAIESNDSFELTYRIRTKDGETRWVWERGRGVFGPDGELEALEGFITDVTDFERRERKLERQNEQFDELASIVSHDLQAPISSVRGRLELAAETGDLEHVDRARDALERLDELRDDLVEVLTARTVVGDREVVDVGRLAAEAWERVDAAPDATLETTGSPELSADPEATQRLLQNLLSNAVEHSDGDVTVRVGGIEDGFYVEDDGPGIDPEDRPNVFDPGFSTKPDGTGMGMASVEQIVEGHGWWIDVTDPEDLDGVRFEVRT